MFQIVMNQIWLKFLGKKIGLARKKEKSKIAY